MPGIFCELVHVACRTSQMAAVFDCVRASVAEWLEERKRVAREPKAKEGTKEVICTTLASLWPRKTRPGRMTIRVCSDYSGNWPEAVTSMPDNVAVDIKARQDVLEIDVWSAPRQRPGRRT